MAFDGTLINSANNDDELTKVYTTTQINDSSVISLQTGAAITDVRCRAVKFNSSGAIVLAGAGDAPFGVGIITNDVGTASGAFVDVQYKNIGLVYAGGAIAKGAAISAGANGVLVAATASSLVVGVALEAAPAAGVYIKALLTMGKGVVPTE